MDATNEKKDENLDELFKGVTYYIAGDISDQITQQLDQYGGKRDLYLSEMVSHVIADSTSSDDYSEAKELFEIPIVSPNWVTLSVKCGKQLPKEAFALEGRIFSGVVAVPFELESEDIEALWGMLTYHGGHCELELNDRTTHLITSATSGKKYAKAKEMGDKVKIVTPDWVPESVTKSEKLEEDKYHPSLVEYPPPTPPTPPPVVESSPPPPQPEAMDTTSPGAQLPVAPLPTTPPAGALRNQHMMDDRSLEVPRPNTPNAKKALARKITSRIHGKASSEPSTPERPIAPPFQHGGSPRASPSLGQISPVPGMGMQLRMDSAGIRNTLRNITNRTAGASPGPGMQMRPTLPPQGPPGKMMNMGMAPQVRPPPPDYPFAPRAAAAQPPPLPQQAPPPQQVPPPTPPVPLSTPPAGGATPSHTHSGSTYYGHDPKENVPPDFCLLSCVFCIVDYQKILGAEEIAAWKTVIEQHGGQVESSYCYRVTHVLCANQKSDVFKMALKEGKRVVSAYWLNDCLLQKKMVPPWQALHLPLSFNSEKPGFNQMISVTNFDGEERDRLKQMISAIGAKYTGYMTHHNSALICKKPGGKKFEKAKDWRIAVVNVQWLSDLVLGNMDALRLPVHVRYLQVGQGREFHMDLSRVTHLMGGWKTPVRIHKETWKKYGPAMISSRGQENSTVPSPPKRLKIDCSGPLPDSDVGKPRILFTLYPKSQVKKLETMVQSLGGIVVTNPRHCTHLVCPSLSRTIKFFIAISTVKYVVTKDWIEDSEKQERFLEENNYALKDEKGEKALGCDLAQSLLRAKTKPLFQGLTFYISPSTVPPVCELTNIIESAGGTVVKRRLPVKHIAAMQDEQGNPKFIVITCLNDLHICQDLINRKIPIFNAEFVLMGVMRQEIDFNIFRISVT